MEDEQLWANHHELADGTLLSVYRSNFWSAWGLGAYEWEPYHSELGGLVWVFDGVMTAHVGDRRWLLTPQHAAWFPASCMGDVVANVPSQAMYIQCSAVASGDAATRVRLGPRAPELLHSLSTTTDSGRAGTLWSQLLSELTVVPDAGLRLALPQDERARDLAFALMDEAAGYGFGEHRTLEDWASVVHASAKTLQRLFIRETGMTFPRWRAQVRLNASLPRLADGIPVQDVARNVGYRSTVGYIDAFRGHFTVTPGQFFSRTHSG